MKTQPKKYYYNLQLREIDKIKGLENKPSLLMHTCCGMCACYPIVYLTQYFDLTLYYYNDNIYPEEEYEKRYSEPKRYVDIFNQENGQNVKLIKCPYHNKEYTQKLAPFKDEPEGGERCHLCYDLRLSEGMRYARENGYDYFTTVMTVSRQKDSLILNQIGEKLDNSETRYFFSDFKKDGGLEKGLELVKKYDIYRQNYCGCVYSYREMLERVKKDYEKNKEAD